MTDFETMARFADDLQTAWTKTAAKPENKKSFKGLQLELQKMRRFLLNEQKDREAQYQEILEDGVFTPKHIGQKRAEIDEKYREAESAVIEGAKTDIRAMVADKYKRLDKMLCAAPTAEQTALLQALQMRGGNVSKGELTRLIPFFYTNYQGMRILESVALAAGYHITIPIDGDILDLYGTLDRAGNYLLDAADELGSFGKVTPRFRAFYYSDPKNPGNADPIFQQFIDMFDVPAQLQDYTVSKKLSAAEAAKVGTYFKKLAADLDDLDPSNMADSITILRETQQIMKKHPDDIELMKRSEYGKYVREVEELEALNQKKAEADEQKKAAASDK